jgi:hypothetical protein
MISGPGRSEPWTPDEYGRLLSAIGKCAKGDWPEIAVIVRTRSMQECKTYQMSYLRRYIEREQWCVGFDGSRLSMVAFDFAACILSRRTRFNETLKVYSWEVQSFSCAPAFLHGESRIQPTGAHENDLTAHGY